MNIKRMLESRYDEHWLTGLQEIIVNSTSDVFCAYTMLPVTDNAFPVLFDTCLKEKGYTIMSVKDQQAVQLPGNNTWTGAAPFKNITNYIEAGSLEIVSIVFMGCYFEKEWYITEHIKYFDTAPEQNTYAAQLRNDIEDTAWLAPVPPVIEMADIQALTSALESTGVTVNDHTQNVTYEQLQKKTMRQTAAMRPYIGQPSPVAYFKTELKENLNAAYEKYMNASVFIPFIQLMKEQFATVFYKTEPLYGPFNYSLIYPHTKEHALAVVKAIEENESTRLFYFLHVASEKKIYKWTFPAVKEAPGFYLACIEEDLKDLSDWGDDYDVANPSVTMDDPRFWSEYVFKKENGDYLYLEETGAENNCKDLYPFF